RVPPSPRAQPRDLQISEAPCDGLSDQLVHSSHGEPAENEQRYYIQQLFCRYGQKDRLDFKGFQSLLCVWLGWSMKIWATIMFRKDGTHIQPGIRTFTRSPTSHTRHINIPTMRMNNIALPRSYRAAKHLALEPKAPLTVDLRDTIMTMTSTITVTIMIMTTTITVTVMITITVIMTMNTMIMRKTVTINTSTGMLRTVLTLKMTMTVLTKRAVNMHMKIMISVTKTTIIMTTITTNIPTLISMVQTAWSTTQRPLISHPKYSLLLELSFPPHNPEEIADHLKSKLIEATTKPASLLLRLVSWRQAEMTMSITARITALFSHRGAGERCQEKICL
ncbi:hypothetical protein M9458_020016, partial [Cirrhinus mrigala]